MKFYVYIIRSGKDKKYYYGNSSDLKKRLSYHNSGKVRSTKHRRPFEIIYYEEFENKTDAIRREKFFKSIDGYNWLKIMKIV